VLRMTWRRAAVPLTVLLCASALVGTPGPALAAATDPAGTQATRPDGPDAAARSTPLTVKSATTEQIQAMAANGGGRLITLGTPASKSGTAAAGANATAATVVTCYLYAGTPYGGGAYNAHIFVDGLVYCDSYVHAGVLTVELFRGASRVANRTATGAYVSALYATAEYTTCSDGVYVGIVGATLTRFDLNPPSITDNEISYPVYISCAPAPPPLVVANPGDQQTWQYASGQAQLSATGGTAPYTWSASGLPFGFSINSGTGLISGASSQMGRFTVTVTAADAAGASASTQFTWIIKPRAVSVGPPVAQLVGD